jgi:predicted DNA-binding protein (MmcQ/YjbR family)
LLSCSTIWSGLRTKVNIVKPVKFEEINKFILGFPKVETSSPFGEDKLAYNFGDQMFAIVDKDMIPLRISLRCDAKLSELLRQKYDEVMPGDHLDTQAWNTIILAGQLQGEEIKDLIRHSYLLVSSGAVVEADNE